MALDDDGTTLPHLQGPGAAVRQVIAGHALRGCRHVVEIGGAGLPITRFLHPPPESITVIDPKIRPLSEERLNGHPCRVRHVARKFQVGDFDLPVEGLGMVLLGLSLKPLGSRPAVTETLLALCRRAERVVIEHQVGLERAEAQLPQLIADAGLRELLRIDLTIRDGVMEHTEHGQRRLMVLVAG
jgi:hypothetical protein